MYLTIYTSGPIGGSLCYCQLTCNGPQQVATAGKHMSHVGQNDGNMCILPISHAHMLSTSLYWPNSTYYVSDNMHVWAHRRELVLLPISLYWPNSTYCICDNIHVWAHWGSLCYCQ